MLKILALNALLGVAGAPAPAVDTVIAVSPGTRLDLEIGARDAEVEIRTWDRNEVQVVSLADIDVRVAGSVVRVGDGGGRRSGREVTYDIRVPRWMSLEVEGTNADVTIEGAGGEVSVETVNGSISVTGGTGRVSLESVQGQLTIADASGRIEAHAGNGSVSISRATGPIDAETVNGNIRLEAIESSDVQANSTNGSLDFEGPIRADGRYRLTTHNGTVRLTVQQGADATVSVSTYNGRYSSTFPVTITASGRDRSYTFLMGNGSARIEASSFNGNVELRRPGEPRGGDER